MTRFLLVAIGIVALGGVEPVLCRADAGPARLVAAGATLPQPILQRWFQEYRAKTGVDIEYSGIGDGGAIRIFSTIQATDSTETIRPPVDFAVLSVAPSSSILRQLPPVTIVPVVADEVVVCYNVHGVYGLQLTPSVLAAIYLGHIKRWNDRRIARFNPSVHLPDEPISTLHHSESTTTTNTFTGYLADHVTEWRDVVGAGKSVKWPIGLGSKGCVGVLGILKQTEGAIGYAELPYAIANNAAIAAIPDATGAFVLPSAGGPVATSGSVIASPYRTVGKGRDLGYPMAGLSYVVVKGPQVANPAVRDWLRWVLTQGQPEAADISFSPLPPTVQEKALGSVK